MDHKKKYIDITLPSGDERHLVVDKDTMFSYGAQNYDWHIDWEEDVYNHSDLLYRKAIAVFFYGISGSLVRISYMAKDYR